MNTDRLEVAIIGAGVVGLSCALFLQRAGCRVTLIDQNEPGLGTSFGNAGLFADYARLPFASWPLLCKMPKMLLDKQSPLSIKAHYLPNLLPYGWHFMKATLPGNYRRGRAALTALNQAAPAADQLLIDASGANELIVQQGILGLFSSEQGYHKARDGELQERRQQGVIMEFLGREQVQQLEPALHGFHVGGVHYTNSRHTLCPLSLSRRYFEHFIAGGGRFVRDRVQYLQPLEQGVRLQTTLQQMQVDRLVIAAGAASKSLLQQLGLSIPLVSERGYHVTLADDRQRLSRPVGWLDKGIFLTPMHDGIRIAGTAEFADPMAAPDPARTDAMQSHAEQMLGERLPVKSSWVGSRPSTPDSLPVIGQLTSHPTVTLAFGHGHLGLTLAAITGQLVSELIRQQPPSLDLSPFRPERFG
ncbi:NAD(P)/FAD-dependent oxidoreductase [Marinobacterium arenosum]|uniref:NAD(P)/FAD-dependent oxidoreductase n=1 Tax=Marinobacterium arenosum TaxID=2862496 RepID=UPI001C987FDB|nr:FAD-dependent oxidoreductase [Marinobacterium arenosum]MBY4675578.1 FAD-binding oxidoreductase [Marinobacterium arenosum]